MGTVRRLEIRQTSGKASRLTITPDRVTVKVTLADAGHAWSWAAAAGTIAAGIDSGRSLRGTFSPGQSVIWLATGCRRPPGYAAFLYDFSGRLLRTSQGKDRQDC